MKCSVCKKKINPLYQVQCKCEKPLCLVHRYPDKHECSYDFLKDNKERLHKELVKVDHKKMEYI